MPAALNSLRSAFAGISPRERRLLFSLGGVLAGLFVVGLWYWSATALDDLESERSAMVTAMRTIRQERPKIRQRQQRREQMMQRYATPAPALTSFVETAARESNVTVSEANDLPGQATEGRKFQRRAVSIRLRRVDLQSLVNFMNAIDSAPFPVAITSVRIRKRFGESNSYDVDDMVIATWDRVAAEARGRSAGGTGANGAGANSEPATGGAR